MSWGVLFIILGAQAIGLILGYSLAYFIGKAIIIKYVEKKANKKSEILGVQTNKAKGNTVR